MKDIIAAIISLADWNRFAENMRQLAKQLSEMVMEYTPTLYENDSDMWLWRKCGGLFYGTKTICASSTYTYASSSIGMGRQRNSLPGTGEATVGAEEMEYEEN